MKPAMENGTKLDLLNVEEEDLVHILTFVVKEVKDSTGRDINGTELLHGLLNSPWLRSLLKVYECLQQYLRSSTTPYLSYASGLSLEILTDLRALLCPSYEARELYCLLMKPHVQALLSAHDVVGLKDYEPVLPPLPEDLANNEEAMRIVCMVKNNQPLEHGVSRGIFNPKDTTRKLIFQTFIPTQMDQREALHTNKYEEISQKFKSPDGDIPAFQQTNASWDRDLSYSVVLTSGYRSGFQDFTKEEDGSDRKNAALLAPPYDVTRSPRTPISKSPPLPPKVLRYVRTAPSSPVLHHRLTQAPTNSQVDLAKQESLDVQLLSQKMATATECMSKSIRENTKGATIRRDERTGEIYVARVIHGGLADRSGLLHAGDRLVEVNGHPVFGLEPEQIIRILAHSHGTVMFKVVPNTDRPANNKTMMFVRAMVDYNPHHDPGIPCVDAGMAFKKGNLLEIVDQTDSLWWQAKKLPCSSTCAGLIPSACMLKRKQKEFWWSQPHTCNKILSTVDEEDDMMALDVSIVETDEEAFESEELNEDENEFSASIDGIYLAGFRRSLRACRRRRVQGGGSGLIRSPCYSSSPTSPYEEVVRYQRHPDDTHRLIALLGPSGVGVNELRRKLIEINPRTFRGATPHTSRPRKMYEEPGREYHFISRDQFDSMVYNNRFVEYGEFRGHFYGTSVDAVKDVLAAGKICIMDIDPDAISSVRTHELKAYIIYIKPPPLAQMKRTRINARVTNFCTSRPFKDEDFYEIEEVGCRMEQHYGQLFDHVIVNDGLQVSCVRLMAAVRRAQEEPQWVPASWIRPTEDS